MVEPFLNMISCVPIGIQINSINKKSSPLSRGGEEEPAWNYFQTGGRVLN